MHTPINIYIGIRYAHLYIYIIYIYICIHPGGAETVQAKQRFLKKQPPKSGKYWGGVLGCSALCGFEHFSSSCLSHACKFNACSPSPTPCLFSTPCVQCNTRQHHPTSPHPTCFVSSSMPKMRVFWARLSVRWHIHA